MFEKYEEEEREEQRRKQEAARQRKEEAARKQRQKEDEEKKRIIPTSSFVSSNQSSSSSSSSTIDKNDLMREIRSEFNGILNNKIAPLKKELRDQMDLECEDVREELAELEEKISDTYSTLFLTSLANRTMQEDFLKAVDDLEQKMISSGDAKKVREDLTCDVLEMVQPLNEEVLSQNDRISQLEETIKNQQLIIDNLLRFQFDHTIGGNGDITNDQ